MCVCACVSKKVNSIFKNKITWVFIYIRVTVCVCVCVCVKTEEPADIPLLYLYILVRFMCESVSDCVSVCSRNLIQYLSFLSHLIFSTYGLLLTHTLCHFLGVNLFSFVRFYCNLHLVCPPTFYLYYCQKLTYCYTEKR